MGVEELKQALDDCIINFDTQVLVTNLLQDYQMSYADVDKILKKHVADEEERGVKFEKRFLVSGEDETTSNEIYTVVDDEGKLKEWLRKLKNAESSLYSVEVAGGAKPAASIFVPMKWCPIQLSNVKTRPSLHTKATTNGKGNESMKAEIKTETKKTKGFDFAATAAAKKQTIATETKNDVTKISETNIKKSPTLIEKPKTPKKSNTLEEQKTTNTTKGNGNAKKGIANFFGPAKSEDKSKKASGVVKPPTPKKMQDFFKKADKTAPAPKAKQQEKTANKSMQLFDDEDNSDDDDEIDNDEQIPSKETQVDVDSSDDEAAQIEALRQKCSEAQESDDDAASSHVPRKRRRIIDSDEDDEENGEPQVKHEKIESKTAENNDEVEETGQSETFLDEDGFVVTIKAKKPAVTKKKAAKAASPKKSPPNKDDKKAPKTTPKSAAKTKQGNIMSFFSKKAV